MVDGPSHYGKHPRRDVTINHAIQRTNKTKQKRHLRVIELLDYDSRVGVVPSPARAITVSAVVPRPGALLVGWGTFVSGENSRIPKGGEAKTQNEADGTDQPDEGNERVLLGNCSHQCQHRNSQDQGVGDESEHRPVLTICDLRKRRRR
jgi:hypothetical protein